MRVLLPMLMCLALPLVAGGETRDPDPVGKALHDIRPAGESCAIEEAAGPQAPKQGQDAGARAELDCAITVTQAVPLIENPATVLVDTRPANAFNTFHINSALSQTVSQLRHQLPLKERPVILVGDGKGDRELYRGCKELRAAGFKSVRVIQGGMLAWLAEKRPVLGYPPDAAELASISPEEMFQAAESGLSLVFLAPAMKAAQGHVSISRVLADTSPKTVQKAVQREVAVAGPRKLVGVVLVAGEDYDPGLIAPTLELLRPTSFLVYRGTLDAYNAFMAAQKASWAARARGPKKPPCTL